MLQKNRLLWIATAGIVLFAMAFVYRRGQDLNWDLLNYHYFQGYSLLHWRFGDDIAAAGLQSFLNPIANILAYVSLKYLSFPASAWLVLFFQLLSLPILVKITREIGRSLGLAESGYSEVVSLLLCMLAPLWWSELGTTFFSSSTAPFVLLGVYFSLRYFSDENKSGKPLILAGVFLGFGAGLKLTNAPYAIGIFVAVAAVTFRSGWRECALRLRDLFIGAVIGFALTAWWNYYIFQRWGSPVFPLYNAIFHSPYYDPINFRDMRWRFGSMSEFLQFIFDSLRGTSKTSEVAFADPRLIVMFVLTFAALLFRKRAPLAKGAWFFSVFFATSFFLWCVAFAYQRYLIPIEILIGLMIWILVSTIAKTRGYINLSMMLILVFCFSYFHAPDWGHIKTNEAVPNPFGLHLPQKIAETPAVYLISGGPLTYILPFLHPDSRFYKVGFSPRVDALIREKLAGGSRLPLRLLTNKIGAFYAWNKLRSLGFEPARTYLECIPFSARQDEYLVCEISTGTQVAAASQLPMNLDFSSATALLPHGLLGYKGLAGATQQGRWSDGDFVEIRLANCLPQGRIRFVFSGYATNPDTDSPVDVFLGDQKTSIVFTRNESEVTANFENGNVCSNTLAIKPAGEVSSLDSGLSRKEQKLNIGLISLRIYPDN